MGAELGSIDNTDKHEEGLIILKVQHPYNNLHSVL